MNCLINNLFMIYLVQSKFTYVKLSPSSGDVVKMQSTFDSCLFLILVCISPIYFVVDINYLALVCLIMET